MSLLNLNNIFGLLSKKSNRNTELEQNDIVAFGQHNPKAFNNYNTKGILFSDLLKQLSKIFASKSSIAGIVADAEGWVTETFVYDESVLRGMGTNPIQVIFGQGGKYLIIDWIHSVGAVTSFFDFNGIGGVSYIRFRTDVTFGVYECIPDFINENGSWYTDGSPSNPFATSHNIDSHMTVGEGLELTTDNGGNSTGFGVGTLTVTIRYKFVDAPPEA